MTKEYKRIRDDNPPTFDSLEQKCNALAEDGWEIFSITDGEVYRNATLVRDTYIRDTMAKIRNPKPDPVFPKEIAPTEKVGSTTHNPPKETGTQIELDEIINKQDVDAYNAAKKKVKNDKTKG